MRHSTAFVLSVCVMLAIACSSSAGQDGYPESEITLVVPFPAGGRTDLTARIVAEGLETKLGAPVVVVNKPGAGGVLGARIVAQAAANGYTLGLFSSALVATQYTVETGTDLNDYEVAGLVEFSPAAIAVRADAPWRNLNELLTAARGDPGGLTIAITPGASSNVFAGGLLDAAGIEMTMVPFKGDAPGVTALAGGHVDVHSGVPASSKTLADAGLVRLLAIAADEPMPQFAGAATFRDAGVDLVIGSFHALYAPKGTPADVMNRLEAALAEVMAERAFTGRMSDVGLGPTYRDSAGAGAFLEKQDAIYRSLITKLGMLHPGRK